MANSKYTGDGRIVIPSDIDRDVYIRKCYDTGRVDVMSYGAGLLRQVAVCTHCIQDIEFPKDHEGYGSPVVYNKIPNREAYVVYGVLKEIDTVYGTSENQFSLSKYSDDGIASIFGDGSGAIVVTSSNNKTGGTIVINVGTNDVGGKMHVNVSGILLSEADSLESIAYDGFKITIPKTDTQNITEISYVRGSGFSMKDEFGNEIVTKKNLIQINGGDNKGIPIVEKLVNKYNTIERKYNNLLSILKAVSIPLAPTGTYPFLPLFQSEQPLSETMQDEIENKKVTH